MQGRERMAARTGFELGRALRAVGRPEEAARQLDRAVHAAQALGTSFEEDRLRASALEFQGC